MKLHGIADIGLEGQGKEKSDPGTPFCPLSGITESEISQANDITQWGLHCCSEGECGGEGEDMAEGILPGSGE